MTRKLHLSLSAAALAAALAVSPASAQVEESVASGLSQLGIQADVEMLSGEQLLEIEGVLNSEDDRVEQTERIERIIARDDAAAVNLGVAQLQDTVSAELAMLEMDTSEVSMLNLTQLAQIENVTSSDDDDAVKRQRIEQIMGSDDGMLPSMGVAQLRDSVTAEMAKLGLDTATVPTLTLADLTEIENVVNSSDDREQQRERVEQIVTN
jgi:hypothetical protein